MKIINTNVGLCVNEKCKFTCVEGCSKKQYFKDEFLRFFNL